MNERQVRLLSTVDQVKAGSKEYVKQYPQYCLNLLETLGRIKMGEKITLTKTDIDNILVFTNKYIVQLLCELEMDGELDIELPEIEYFKDA